MTAGWAGDGPGARLAHALRNPTATRDARAHPLAMKKNLSLNGLILLSGNLMAEPRFPKTAGALPFYAAHGSRDPILPVEGAKRLVDKLETLGFRGKLTVFNGGHEIPPTVINEVKSFLVQFAD